MINQRSGTMVGNAFFQMPVNHKDCISFLGTSTDLNKFSTFKDYLTNSAYQVPTGKVLIITGIQVATGQSSGSQCGFGYGDTSVSNSTQPTNFVGSTNFIQPGAYSQPAGLLPTFLKVPAGKYPCFFSGAAGVSFGAIGFLVDA